MKKLMIAFAIAGMAICANAAKFNWGFADEIEGGTAGDMTGYTAYLVNGFNTDDVAGSLATALASASFDTWASDCYPEDNYYYYSYNGGATGISDDLIGEQTFQLVFANGNKYTSVDVTGSVLADDDKTTPTAFKNEGLSLDTATFTEYGSVPEPTSGLLLLLGVAGLALKRRRA